MTLQPCRAYIKARGLAQVKKSVYRWCWARLVANKPPIYYSKSPFWPQNLMFGTSGSLEQLENLMKKHLSGSNLQFNFFHRD